MIRHDDDTCTFMFHLNVEDPTVHVRAQPENRVVAVCINNGAIDLTVFLHSSDQARSIREALFRAEGALLEQEHRSIETSRAMHDACAD